MPSDVSWEKKEIANIRKSIDNMNRMLSEISQENTSLKYLVYSSDVLHKLEFSNPDEFSEVAKLIKESEEKITSANNSIKQIRLKLNHTRK